MKKSLLNFILVLICLMMTTSLLSIQVAADSPISLEEAKNIVEKWVSETYPLSNEGYNFYVNDWHISPEEIESRYGKVCDVIAENERWIGFELDFIEVVEYYAVNKYSGDVVYITGGHGVGRSKVIQMFESLIDVGDNATISVEVNGAKLSFDQPPVMQNNRVFVPMRAICNALGIEVYWDDRIVSSGDEECKITAINGNTLIEIGMYNNDGNWYAFKSDIDDVYGGTSIDIPTEFCPIFVNDRTLLATRFIAELFGFKVDWDNNTSTVRITGTVNQNHRSEDEMARIDAFTPDAAIKLLNDLGYDRLQGDYAAIFDEHGKYFVFVGYGGYPLSCYYNGRVELGDGHGNTFKVIQEKTDYVPVIPDKPHKMSTGEFYNRIQKGIDYFNQGKYIEARDEIQWFCDAHWYDLDEYQQETVLSYLNDANYYIEHPIKNYEGSWHSTKYPNNYWIEITNQRGKYVDIFIGAVWNNGNRLAVYEEYDVDISGGNADFYFEDSRIGDSGICHLTFYDDSIYVEYDIYDYGVDGGICFGADQWYVK